MQDIIRQKLEAEFPGDPIEINGSYSDGAHIEVIITSARFKNLSIIDQHRLINETLKDFLQNGTIHALKIKTRTP